MEAAGHSARRRDAPTNTGRDELFVVLGLAVAAAIAIKVPALFGHPINPNEDFPLFYARNASLFVLPLLTALLRLEARVEPRQRHLACDGLRGRGCVGQCLSLSRAAARQRC